VGPVGPVGPVGGTCRASWTRRTVGPVRPVAPFWPLSSSSSSSSSNKPRVERTPTLAPDARFRRNAARALRRDPVLRRSLMSPPWRFTQTYAPARLCSLSRAMAPAVTMSTRLSETTAAPTADDAPQRDTPTHARCTPRCRTTTWPSPTTRFPHWPRERSRQLTKPAPGTISEACLRDNLGRTTKVPKCDTFDARAHRQESQKTALSCGFRRNPASTGRRPGRYSPSQRHRRRQRSSSRARLLTRPYRPQNCGSVDSPPPATMRRRAVQIRLALEGAETLVI
jgi:hypothetical protein